MMMSTDVTLIFKMIRMMAMMMTAMMMINTFLMERGVPGNGDKDGADDDVDYDDNNDNDVD